MPDNVEVGVASISEERRGSDVSSADVRTSGVVAWSRSQVCWGDLKEIGFKLGLAVLLTVQATIFGDGSAIVVAGVAIRVTDVAPVGATVGLGELSARC